MRKLITIALATVATFSITGSANAADAALLATNDFVGISFWIAPSITDRPFSTSMVFEFPWLSIYVILGIMKNIEGLKKRASTQNVPALNFNYLKY